MGLFLQDCSPKVSNVDIPIDSLQNFSTTGERPLQERWWEEFNDPQLNYLVDSGLSNNLNLLATWQQIEAARYVVRREQSFLIPEVEASAQTASRRPVPDFAGGENTQFGISASYEIDLWGRIRSGIQAEKYRAAATLEDYKAMSISMSAEIALAWYQLSAATTQLNLISNQIETNESIIRLIRARFGSGQVRGVDILRQMQLLESTKDQRIQIETTVALLENQLAVLTGRQPQIDFEMDPDTLPDVPPLPETGVPMELINRRPDVQRDYQTLLAADRDYAVAMTSRYPRLSISSSGQLRSNDLSSLLSDWAYSIGANLVAPLFYGGRLKAEANRALSAKDQALYNYGQTILTSFREVEDALIQESQQRERIAVLNRRVELAESTYNQLRVEFLNGLTDYLDVLLALDQEQQLRRNLISAELTLIQFRIALYRALAGGIVNENELNPEL